MQLTLVLHISDENQNESFPMYPFVFVESWKLTSQFLLHFNMKYCFKED